MECSKGYETRFFFIFKLVVYSEDRQNGEFKNFVYLYAFGLRFISLTYRTGGYNDSKPIDKDNVQHYYIGYFIKYNFIRLLIDKIKHFIGDIIPCYMYKSKFVRKLFQKYYNGYQISYSDGLIKSIKPKLSGYEYVWENKSLKAYLHLDKDLKPYVDEYYKDEISKYNNGEHKNEDENKS